MSFETISMERTGESGTLVFSDSPEYVKDFGVAARGTIDGSGRIYYYHVNETGKKARVLVYGESKKKTDITVTREIKGDASDEYIPTGRTLSYRETLLPSHDRTVTLPKKERTIIAEYDPAGIDGEDLVSGIVEVNTKRPVTFGVAIVPWEPGDDAAGAVREAEDLPVDEHEMRGTFPMDVYMENKTPWNLAEGPAQVIVGNRTNDAFYMGKDEIDGVERENTGNYGMTYHMTIHTAGEGKYKLYMNPMGGLYEGTFSVGDGFLPTIYTTEGNWHYFGSQGLNEVREMGEWTAGKDLRIRFVVAGATYLPIRFLLVPVLS